VRVLSMGLLSIWLLKAGHLSSQWPYTYDSCDVGTVPNQTVNGLPIAATKNGDQSNKGILSFLPGQRLSRCTCPGESHPGPVHSDGSYVGRGAPEIDMYEAQVCEYFPPRVRVTDPRVYCKITKGMGQVSQSAQWAVSRVPLLSTPL